MRTYTMASPEDLAMLKDVVWPRHLESTKEFGIAIHGIWTRPQDEEPRLYVLESIPDGIDHDEVGRRFMESSAFRSDVEGFDMATVVGFDLLPLTPAAGSPLQ